ncbi:MAG: hypothetical protein H6741_20020 [Alphaproteobacteria bacterium]|nr:hypothetical protein [Alphaproteobacteria bacterium]
MSARRPDDLGQIGDWLSPAITHLTKLGKEYVLGAAIAGAGLFGAMMLCGGVFGMLALFGSMAAQVSDAPLLGVAAMFLGGVLSTFTLFLCAAPISLALDRGVLAVNAGEPFDLGVFQRAIADTPSAVVITLVSGLLSGLGTLFCVFPGWILGGLFLFAMPHFAHTRCSGMEALRHSVALAKPRLLAVVLYAIMANFLVSAVASVPVVGVFLAMPVHAALSMSAYLAVIGEPPLRAA